MPTIGEEVRPREWLAAVRSPSVIRTHHSAAKCRKYLTRKQTLAIHPRYDRNVELVYRVRATHHGFRAARKLAGIVDSPLGYSVSVEEGEGGAILLLRLDLLPWFIWSASGISALLAVSALFLMDWWPCLLTLGILGVATLGTLHVLATDREELSHFLADRFGEAKDDWFPADEDGSPGTQ